MSQSIRQRRALRQYVSNPRKTRPQPGATTRWWQSVQQTLENLSTGIRARRTA